MEEKSSTVVPRMEASTFEEKLIEDILAEIKIDNGFQIDLEKECIGIMQRENQDMVRCKHSKSKIENESLATSKVQCMVVESVFQTPY